MSLSDIVLKQICCVCPLNFTALILLSNLRTSILHQFYTVWPLKSVVEYLVFVQRAYLNETFSTHVFNWETIHSKTFTMHENDSQSLFFCGKVISDIFNSINWCKISDVLLSPWSVLVYTTGGFCPVTKLWFSTGIIYIEYFIIGT